MTRSKLYTDHLHGIDQTAKDVFMRDTGEKGDKEDDPVSVSKILNRHLVKQPAYQRLMQEGGTGDRVKRLSLTFRDVEKVFKPRFR